MTNKMKTGSIIKKRFAQKKIKKVEGICSSAAKQIWYFTSKLIYWGGDWLTQVRNNLLVIVNRHLI